MERGLGFGGGGVELKDRGDMDGVSRSRDRGLGTVAVPRDVGSSTSEPGGGSDSEVESGSVGLGRGVRAGARLADVAAGSRRFGSSSVPSGCGLGPDSGHRYDGGTPAPGTGCLVGGSGGSSSFQPDGGSDRDGDVAMGGELRPRGRASGSVGVARRIVGSSVLPRFGSDSEDDDVDFDMGGELCPRARTAGSAAEAWRAGGSHVPIGGRSVTELSSPAWGSGEGGRSSLWAASRGGRGDRMRGQMGTGAPVHGEASASSTPPDWPAWIQLLGGNRQLVRGDRRRGAGGRGWNCAFGDGDASPQSEQ